MSPAELIASTVWSSERLPGVVSPTVIDREQMFSWFYPSRTIKNITDTEGRSHRLAVLCFDAPEMVLHEADDESCADIDYALETIASRIMGRFADWGVLAVARDLAEPLNIHGHSLSVALPLARWQEFNGINRFGPIVDRFSTAAWSALVEFSTIHLDDA